MTSPSSFNVSGPLGSNSIDTTALVTPSIRMDTAVMRLQYSNSTRD